MFPLQRCNQHLGWVRNFSLRQCQGKRLYLSHRSRACQGSLPIFFIFTARLLSQSFLDAKTPFLDAKTPCRGQILLLLQQRGGWGPRGERGDRRWRCSVEVWGLGDGKWDSCPSLPVETRSLYADLSQRGYILGYIYVYICFPSVKDCSNVLSLLC